MRCDGVRTCNRCETSFLTGDSLRGDKECLDRKCDDYMPSRTMSPSAAELACEVIAHKRLA